MQNNPFDDDMNVLPPLPPTPDGKKYDNFPSAEGFETIPEGWKPRAGRELPALRCTHERDDGSRCKNFGVRGTGFNGTKSMCFIHGGSLPNVKKKAEATLLVAKMRLVQHTGLALDTLFDLTKPGVADNIRLKASTEVLDRAGLKGGFELDVNVETTVNPAEIIQEKMKAIAERATDRKLEEMRKEQEAQEVLDAEQVVTISEVVDAEEVTDEDTKSE